MTQQNKQSTTEFRCMCCGKWHNINSRILDKHIGRYFYAGGTYTLDKWERRNTADHKVTAPQEQDTSSL